MDKAKLNWWLSSGASASYQSNVQAWYNQGISDGGTPPSGTVLTALSNFMTALDGYGILTNMVTGNVMHAGSKEFIKLNLKNPATYKFTESGTVTSSSGNGCKSDGSSYFDQPFNTNEFAGIESTLTCIQYVSESNTTALDQSSYGAKTNGTTGFLLLRPRRVTSTNGVSQHYDAANGFTSSDHKGLYICTNNGTNNLVWKDNVLDTSAMVPSAPTVGNHRYVLARNNAGVADQHYTAAYVALDFVFNVAFDSTKAGNFYTAFQTYKTAVSLP